MLSVIGVILAVFGDKQFLTFSSRTELSSVPKGNGAERSRCSKAQIELSYGSLRTQFQFESPTFPKYFK